MKKSLFRSTKTVTFASAFARAITKPVGRQAEPNYIKMNSQSYKTVSVNKEDVERDWYVVDATNVPLGRLASRIATILRGKHKPDYTPHVDTGDHVIVINAAKLRLTGKKMQDKVYLTYSGYPGGQKATKAHEIMAKRPERLVEMAVKGMLPKNRLGRAMFRKLHVYADAEHRHEAQQPKELTL